MPIQPELLKKEIGRRVARARREAGLTQEGLAERLDVNLVTVSRLERGHSLPGVMSLLRICEELSLPPARLFDLPLRSSRRGRVVADVAERLKAADDADFQAATALLDRVLPRRRPKGR
jgi:transcriptional regulator with XRE-family HTH domain